MTAPLRYLALGDSYTIGEGVTEADRWPAQLVARLRADGLRLGDPEIVAVTGWTTTDLAAGLDAARPSAPYDLVTLLIGVNDQYDGVPVETFRRRFRGLVERATGYARGERERVVVVSIPDWSVTPFAEDRDRGAVARQLRVFNGVIVTQVLRGQRYVDITPLSRTQGNLVVPDGLHPNAEAYEAWAARIAPAARAALGVDNSEADSL